MDNVNKEEFFAKNNELSLPDLVVKVGAVFKYLCSKWILIVAVGLLGSALGVTYSLLKKPIYKADLSFALEDDKASSGGLGAAMGLASQFGIDIGGGSGGGAFAGDNLLMFMKSRSMVESTLLTAVNIDGKQQTLADYYINFNKLRDQWKSKPNLNNLNFPVNADRTLFSRQQDSVLGTIYTAINKGVLSVDKVDKKLSIITITVRTTNEVFSKYFTEILVKTVSNFYIDTKTKKSSQNVKILQKQTDSVRVQLNSAITGVASSVDVNPNANPALQILKAPSQRRQVDVQANQAILTELVKNLEVSKVSLRKETPLIQIIDRPIFPLEVERFSKSKGILMGGILAGFCAVLFLIVKKVLKRYHK